MPLQDYMKIVSVDDHIIEHPRVWQDRLPAKFRDDGPKIIEDENNHHVWIYEGRRYPYIGLNAVAGRDPKDFGMEPVRYDDMIPGCYDPALRIKDMDLDGIDSAMCFPSFPGFGGNVFMRGTDKDLALECIRAWNDFHIDEWCATAPGRLIPLSLLPVWDIDESIKELHRVAAKGSHTVSFPDATMPLGLPSYHTDNWERLWDAFEEADMPLSLHFGSSGFSPGFSFSASAMFPNAPVESEAPFAACTAVFSTNHMWTTVDLLLSGTLQRHPNLKFALSEGGIGWIPYILERTDQVWERHRWYQPIDKETRPSDLFRKHFWGCFIDDVHGLENRHLIGVDRIMLEIDYPHSDSSWPNSRKRANEVLANVPDDEAQMITELNARKLYHWNS